MRFAGLRWFYHKGQARVLFDQQNCGAFGFVDFLERIENRKYTPNVPGNNLFVLTGKGRQLEVFKNSQIAEQPVALRGTSNRLYIIAFRRSMTFLAFLTKPPAGHYLPGPW